MKSNKKKHNDVRKGVDKVKKAVLTYTVLGLALLVLAPSAKATLLVPGATVAPSAEVASGGILADTGLLPFVLGDGTSGTVAEIVIADSANPFGAGDITFIYQVQVTAGPGIEHLTGFDYAGFATDVQSGGAGSGGSIIAGGVAPFDVNRAATGSVVSFNFIAPGVTPILPGSWSEALIIATDATTYKPGTIGIIDGSAAGLLGYAPAVPEPATLSLMGMGLLSLLGFRKRENA